ncbi:hypothetical protein [Candidatus Hadarchaeum sp.]
MVAEAGFIFFFQNFKNLKFLGDSEAGAGASAGAGRFFCLSLFFTGP